MNDNTFHRYMRLLAESSSYVMLKDFDGKYKKKEKHMKKPYELIFDTICRRVQYEKDIMEMGNPRNRYKEWNKFLQQYIMLEKQLETGDK